MINVNQLNAEQLAFYNSLPETMREGYLKSIPTPVKTTEGGLRVSEKGALSAYGLGRFPVTLYKSQWLKLLDMADAIRAFIKANESKLKEKPAKAA
jgi:hypothetical protein